MSELFKCPLYNVARIGINLMSVFENVISTFVLPPTFCVGKQCRFFHQIPTNFLTDICEEQSYCGLLTAWYVIFPTIKICCSGTNFKALDLELRKIIERTIL
jgi:hypothetical protein